MLITQNPTMIKSIIVVERFITASFFRNSNPYRLINTDLYRLASVQYHYIYYIIVSYVLPLQMIRLLPGYVKEKLIIIVIGLTDNYRSN